MKPVTPGATREDGFDTVDSDSAEAIGNVGVDVVSSQALIRFVELTCADLVAGNLEAEEATVGVGFDLVHTKPARIGARIDVVATLRGMERRMVAFDVDVRSGGTSIMHGTHSRAVVDLARFMERSEPNQNAPADRD